LKKFITSLTIILVIVVLFFNIPGNVTPAKEKGEKLPPLSAASKDVSVYFVKTAQVKTLDALTVAQGSIFSSFEIVHGGVLVKHLDDVFLFDTGLGNQIDEQFESDMPFWLKPLMKYEKGESIAEQLKNNPIFPEPNRIYLSHAHWDHASGIVDFPDLDILVPEKEMSFVKTGKPPSIFPSQVSSNKIKWKEYTFNNENYAGFDKSLDLYGDGTVILVSLAGHSPGSIGMFVNAADGVRRFFIGDAVWNIESVLELKRKFWFSSNIVDNDKNETDKVIAKIHALLQTNPELKIIPAHDLSTWK